MEIILNTELAHGLKKYGILNISISYLECCLVIFCFYLTDAALMFRSVSKKRNR